ncbi:hypothetical protein RND71_033050 [Anisodus tanguticus]|uniref:Uncharacterized protein n=1 Tax=Anisodus tanguticus TaxID=243964 RepID=A0AAE1R7S5_9SOLA|nr:hypothetical protein RND71_033050 [Anisodus tanguticus]
MTLGDAYFVRLSKSVPLIEIKSNRDTIDISEYLGNGDILEAFVYHMVEEPHIVPPLLDSMLAMLRG